MQLKHAFPRKGTAVQRVEPLAWPWDTEVPGSIPAESAVSFPALNKNI